jgi:hypothetical protein
MANEIKTPCLAILSAFMMAWLVLAACTSESHEDEIARAVEATVQAMPTATIKSTATVTKQPSPTTTPTESPTEKPMISLSLPTVTPTPLSRIFGEEIVALGCEYDEFQAIEFCSNCQFAHVTAPPICSNGAPLLLRNALLEKWRLCSNTAPPICSNSAPLSAVRFVAATSKTRLHWVMVC